MSAALEPPLLRVVVERIEEASAATKCHACGCFQQTVRALAATSAGGAELAPTLARAEQRFAPQKYDCLGCPTCFPSLAAAAFEELFPEAGAALDLCPTQLPAARAEWPPLPGDYAVVDPGGSVAVCTLDSTPLVEALAGGPEPGLAIVGSMRTENLGIERLVQNVVANPRIRTLILCGAETKQGVGHLAGQSLASLLEHGVDAERRIVGAQGKRPVLRNLDVATIERFRRQIALVSRIGVVFAPLIRAEIQAAHARGPGPFEDAPVPLAATIEASPPARLVQDPAGWLVVYADARRAKLRVEHFTNAGVLTCVVEGDTPAAVSATVIERGLLTRLDHAAYLGRELARAEYSMRTGEPYVQDRAPG